MSAVPTFTSAPPGLEPKPFRIVGWRWEGTGADRERVEVDATFEARTDVSYGLVLRELDAIGTGGGSVYDVFRKVLVDENTDPENEEDERSEYERFEDFVASEDVFVHQDALMDTLRWVAGEQADRPTTRPSGSRPTNRAARRGSGARRR